VPVLGSHAPNQFDKKFSTTTSYVGFELDTEPSIPYPARDKKGSRKMTKGAEHQLKRLVIVLLLLAFSLVGCAHRNVVIPSSAPLDASFPPAARLPDVGQGRRAGLVV